MRNKKAQLGETMTWIVATIIIVVILTIFIYSSSILAKVKIINFPDLKVDSAENVWIETKTFLAFEFKDENQEIIENWIGEGSS
jgi:hypothetical protein